MQPRLVTFSNLWNNTPGLTKLRILLVAILSVIFVGTLAPVEIGIPVKHATRNDWNQNTFWYEPWGKSGVHKGIDIFAPRSTAIIGPASGIVVFTGELELGGKIVVMLAAGWRLHYFAHLERIDTRAGSWIDGGEQLGTVGDTGNAVGKQPHLHYSIITLLPYPWRIDGASQGWKKMFYLNPIDYMR